MYLWEKSLINRSKTFVSDAVSRPQRIPTAQTYMPPEDMHLCATNPDGYATAQTCMPPETMHLCAAEYEF